jgi:hypothetical protein
MPECTLLSTTINEEKQKKQKVPTYTAQEHNKV